ncbi:MAG: hypothetical protein U1F57_11130 [bacterium]
MIPTFIIDEPILILIGLLAGYFVPKGWTKSLFKTRAFLAGNFIALGFMSLAAYGYVMAPDWMFGYLLPASKVPFWMVVYAFILYYVLFLGGFFLHQELKKIHPALAALALVLALAASILVVLPVLPAYQTIATYEEFYKGGGVPLNQSAMGKNTTIPGIVLLVGGVVLLVWSKRQKPS